MFYLEPKKLFIYHFHIVSNCLKSVTVRLCFFLRIVSTYIDIKLPNAHYKWIFTSFKKITEMTSQNKSLIIFSLNIVIYYE